MTVLTLTYIFVATAHHPIRTHFLSDRVGVAVAEAVLAGLVLSVVLVTGDRGNHRGHRLDHRLDHIGRGNLVVFVGLSVGLVGVTPAITDLLLVLV